MHKWWSALLAVAACLLVTAAPAHAITGDFVEDNEHPYVGLLVVYDANGEFLGRCSGSLLSPTVFLTAGHCVEGAMTARVYFQQDAGVNYDPETQVDPYTGYPDYCAAGTLGTLCATSDELYSYGYPAGYPETKDIGLVILDQPITLSEYGVLAAAGSLDALATRRGLQNETLTVSGYGLTYKNQEQSGKPNISYRERLMALSRFVNVKSNNTDGFNVQTVGNGKGQGGTCNGDSGGPVFYGGYDSNIIVGVTSFGLNALCRGSDFAYRTDQAAVIDWILDHAPAGEQIQVAAI